MKSPSSVERNDIDISKLFNWGKEFEIDFKGTKLKVYVRLVGDADLNRARVFALRKSAEMRKKLRTDGSDEHMAYIPDFDQIEKDALVGAIIYNQTKDYTLDAIDTVEVEKPKELSSDASLEDQEKNQEEVDNYPALREGKIRDYIIKRADEEKQKLEKLDKKTLYDMYVKTLINQVCEAEMLVRFREVCTYFGTYKDKNYKTKLFSSFEQFDNLPEQIKDGLVQTYQSLDFEGEELKN